MTTRRSGTSKLVFNKETQRIEKQTPTPSREDLIAKIDNFFGAMGKNQGADHEPLPRALKYLAEAAALLREEEWKKWPEEKPEKEGMYLVSEEGDVFDAHYDGLDWSDSNTNGPFEPDAWRTIPAFQPKTGEA